MKIFVALCLCVRIDHILLWSGKALIQKDPRQDPVKGNDQASAQIPLPGQDQGKVQEGDELDEDPVGGPVEGEGQHHLLDRGDGDLHKEDGFREGIRGEGKGPPGAECEKDSNSAQPGHCQRGWSPTRIRGVPS